MRGERKAVYLCGIEGGDRNSKPNWRMNGGLPENVGITLNLHGPFGLATMAFPVISRHDGRLIEESIARASCLYVILEREFRKEGRRERRATGHDIICLTLRQLSHHNPTLPHMSDSWACQINTGAHRARGETI